MSNPENHPLTLGEILALRRNELGLSQEALAELLGRSWRSEDVQRLENSPMLMPSWIRLKELAEVLQMPLDELRGLALPSGKSSS